MKLLSVFSIFFAISILILAQEPQSPIKADGPEETDELQKPVQTRRIELINALTMEFDKNIGDDARRVIGNVTFKHEDAYLNCDSAYLYSVENSLKAFSNIHIQIGDSIDIFGDLLYYDGNTSIAELHGNVKMKDENMVLTTEHLVYDLKENTANYYDGGRIVDKDNVLTSKWGFYYSDLKHFFFKDDVVLVNPDYNMYSDTLKYNTRTEISHFFGPTTIVSDENTIYCKNGWYDTKNDIAQFNREAFITNKEHSITGDSLFYDRNTGYGKAIMNVVIEDTVQNVIINGNIGEHFEKDGLSVITDEALLNVISDNDTLFLHADTLKYLFLDEPVKKEKKIAAKDQPLTIATDSLNDNINIIVNDSINDNKNIVNDSIIDNSVFVTDSIGDNNVVLADSIHDNNSFIAIEEDEQVNEIRKLFAYNHAKFYRSDMQGISDSITYNFGDSTIYMYNNPILWTEEHQLKGNIIEVYTWDSILDKAHLIDNAFIISQEDTDNFNQIKGRTITGHFNKNLLYKVDVLGNGETIYYVRDENEDMVGINKAISANMTIFVEDNQVTQIIFRDDPVANLYPPEELLTEEKLLRHFEWHINLRPKSKEDVFLWR